MANVGLKSNSKQLKFSAGKASVYVNLCKEDKNIIIDIPFFSTKYPFEYDFGIIYNHQNSNVNGVFGYGMDYKIPQLIDYVSGSYVDLQNSDQSLDRYLYVNWQYVHDFNKTYIDVDINGKYVLHDKIGNTYKFDPSGTCFPIEIKYFDGRTITVSRPTSSLTTFSLGTNRKVDFNMPSSKVTSCNLSMTDIGYADSVAILYDNDGNTYVTNFVYSPTSALRNIVSFISMNNTLIIYDRNSNRSIKIYNNTDQIVVEEYGKSLNLTPSLLSSKTIDYAANKTTVTDNFGKKTYYYFNNGVSMYEYNNFLKLAKNYYIDSTNNLITYESDYFKIKNTNSILLTSFASSGISVSNYSQILWNSSYYSQFLELPYVISGSGTLTYTKIINGVMGDNYQLSMFVRVNSIGTFKVQLLKTETVLVEQNSRKTTSDGEFELITLGVHLDTSIESLKINIIATNANVDVSTIRLVNKSFGTYYTYDNNSNLISTISSIGTTTYTYYSNNLVHTISYPNGKTITYTYDGIFRDKIAKIEDSTGRELEYEYDLNSHNVISKKKMTSDLLCIKTMNTFNGSYDLTTTVDELGNYTFYSYSNHLITSISYPESITDYMEHNGQNALSKIQRNNSIVEYVYNDDLSLTGIKCNSILNIEKNYWSNSFVNEVDFYTLPINKYSYNSYNQLNEIKYGTNSDKTTFVYDSKSRLTNVKKINTSNEITKNYIYTYDSYSNLSQKQCCDANGVFASVNYTYDEDGRIITDSSVDLEYRYDNYDDIVVKKIGIANLKYFTYDTTFETSSVSLYRKRLSTFDIFPLNSDLISLNGNYKPYKFNVINGYNAFEFREVFNSNALGCSNTNLAYKFGFSATGTMIVKLELLSTSQTGYVFSNYDNYTSNKIIVKIKNGYVYLTVNNRDYNTNIPVSLGLNTIALSFDEDVEGLDLYKYVRVYVNGYTYERSVEIQYDSYFMTTYIGGANNANYKLNGYIRNLAIKGEYVSFATLSAVDADLDVLSNSIQVDKLDRITTKKIKHGTSLILKHEYTYVDNTEFENNDNLDYKSNVVASELITINNNTITRSYTYDSLNRIVAISDSFFGNHTFTYADNNHHRDFLEEETSLGQTISYDYDNNGNITSVNNLSTNETITNLYDQTYKDRLVKCNNSNVYYSNTSPGNPSGYHNFTYTFEGKQLIHLQKYESGEYKDIYYLYNDEGLIIRKTINYTYVDETEPHTEVTNYFYEGDKLVIESKGNLITEYLYDASGNLYGLISNNVIYYYIRDILNNIIGIVNSNGNLVVRYDYDAYGYNVESYHTGNDIYNPFKYKCYYYDEDAEMYYCKSRFYNPFFHRWLNNDDASYLDNSNPACVNLYAYCYNNPVMYVDGDGTFPQWAKYLIGGAFILAGLAATVATGGAFLPALAATAKAVAISTAISAGIGALAGGISSQSWKGAFDGLLEGASDGFMWGGIFAGTAQMVSAGFKVAANMGAATGRKGGIQLFKNIKVLSPNNSGFYENGGTLIKFGKNLRFDVGSKTLLHAHAFGFNHIPIGTSLASLIGGLDAILSL